MREALSKALRDRPRCRHVSARRGSRRPRGLPYRVHLGVGDLPLESPEPRHLESVLAHQRVDLLDPIEPDVSAERIVVIAVLERAEYRLRHARLARPRREPEHEPELDRA